MGKSLDFLDASRRSPCHNYSQMSEGPGLGNRAADDFKNIYLSVILNFSLITHITGKKKLRFYIF